MKTIIKHEPVNSKYYTMQVKQPQKLGNLM